MMRAMDATPKRDFDNEAATWDDNPVRAQLAADLAEVLLRELEPSSTMDALDYGCGTGLVTLRFQPRVRSITGADSSQGMLDVLAEKARRAGLENVTTRLLDLTQGGAIDARYHLVFSTMALHHVPEPAALFSTLHGLLLPGGLLGVADLDTEDGSFHGDNTGVHHFGFDRPHLEGLARGAGFADVRTLTAAQVSKHIADGSTRTFPIFLLVARRP